MKGFVWETISSMIAKVVAAGIRLAVPPLGRHLDGRDILGHGKRDGPSSTDRFLGSVNQIPLRFGLLWAGWFFIPKQPALETESWLGMIRHVVEYFRFMGEGRHLRAPIRYGQSCRNGSGSQRIRQVDHDVGNATPTFRIGRMAQCR